MDITVNVGDYILNVRAAGIIIHNNKLLVHKNINSDHYALIGGRIKAGEDSASAVKRELSEELGKNVEITNYVATVENFFEMKGHPYHEILFIYQLEFTDAEDIKILEPIKNCEGKDYLQYEWLDIDKIDNYNLLPQISKKLLKENKFPTHKINIDEHN